MTAAVPLVERLAEALLSQWWAEGAGVDEAGSDRAEAEHYARALLPVVDQAVAEARGEAAEPSYAEIVRAHAKTQAESSRTVDWRSFDAGYRAARADAIATTEGAPRPRWVDLFGAAPDFPCHHDWSLRPESDTFACGICGEER